MDEGQPEVTGGGGFLFAHSGVVGVVDQPRVSDAVGGSAIRLKDKSQSGFIARFYRLIICGFTGSSGHIYCLLPLLMLLAYGKEGYPLMATAIARSIQKRPISPKFAQTPLQQGFRELTIVRN